MFSTRLTSAELSSLLASSLLVFVLGQAGCTAEKAEGRPWVHDIRFVGLKSVKKKDLKSKIAAQESSWVPWAPRKYLDPYMVPSDRERIVAYYHAHGYFDARVTDAKVKARKTRKPSVDIEFKVEEGEPTKITKVNLVGLGHVAERPSAFQKRMALKPGQILVHDRYMDQKKVLGRMLQMRGYAWAEVEGEVKVDREAHVADVTLTADPGVVAKFGTIEVEGASRVRPIDIERTADIVPGKKFSASEVEDARGRIYNLGVFGSVRLRYEHDPNDPTLANIKVSVQEGQFNELRLGGGFGIESDRNDVHLLVQYTKRNFLGGLRVLRLRLEPAYVVLPAIWTTIARQGPATLAEAIFTQPLLFGVRHLELRWTIGYDLGIDYAYQDTGPRTQLGVYYGFWRQRVQIGFSYNFQFLKFFNTDTAILDDPNNATTFGYVDPYRVGWWQQDISLDLRDKPLEPHKGVYLSVSVEEGGIYAGGAFQYEKIVPDARAYVPMGKRVTFAARAQFGQMFVQGDTGSPITRRLYLGGPSSHRGFSYNRLSYQVQPYTPDFKGHLHANGMRLPVGGDESLLLQGELRVRIVKLFGNWFGAVAFADGGDVGAPSGCIAPAGNSPCPDSRIHITNLHWAVGAGLRYATVIGTIRLDVAGRLNRKDGPYDADPGSWGAFHISVGEAF